MSSDQLTLDLGLEEVATSPIGELPLEDELRAFDQFSKNTVMGTTVADANGKLVEVETFINEFWTSKQRAAHSLHEISYRACFKPQLPRFFIERLTQPGDVVYDPFSGRGTTLLESALLSRIPIGCDINPLSPILTLPRLEPPTPAQIAARLSEIELDKSYEEYPEELLVFYHPETLREICALKEYLIEREKNGDLDSIDRWIRVVAINRLTGHSKGFFSVYTLPPNQTVSIDSQKKINKKRDQTPPLRDVKSIIIKKSRSLLRHCDESTRNTLSSVAKSAICLTQSSVSVPEIPSNSVALAVTSPPFLDVVNYAQDNWLRCWFCDIDPKAVPITMLKRIEDWQDTMTEIFAELKRVLKPSGHVAFEVGEVRHGKVKLEEAVIPCGVNAGLQPLLVLINDQKFTKTANVWGIDNLRKGTNTNRIIVFKKR